MTGAIELRCGIWVSWEVYLSGAQSMKSNGKFRVMFACAKGTFVIAILASSLASHQAEQTGIEKPAAR
jgi:hypothetical protein